MTEENTLLLRIAYIIIYYIISGKNQLLETLEILRK